MAQPTTRRILAGAIPLAVSVAMLSACGRSSSPVYVAGQNAPLANSGQITVVQGTNNRIPTANPLGLAALVASDAANQVAVGVQSATGNPFAPKSNVYTTSPGIVVVSPSHQWKPFPGVNNTPNGTYVIGPNGQAQPAGAVNGPLQGALTPAQQQALNSAGLMIVRPR